MIRYFENRMSWISFSFQLRFKKATACPCRRLTMTPSMPSSAKSRTARHSPQMTRQKSTRQTLTTYQSRLLNCKSWLSCRHCLEIKLKAASHVWVLKVKEAYLHVTHHMLNASLYVICRHYYSFFFIDNNICDHLCTLQISTKVSLVYENYIHFYTSLWCTECLYVEKKVPTHENIH